MEDDAFSQSCIQIICQDEALKHPYLEDLHLPETETTCKDTFDFSFEDHLKTKQDIQDHMWEEVQSPSSAFSLSPLAMW